MRRFLLVLAVLLALALGVRWVALALASDETKIRHRIEGMVEAFNDQRMNPIMAGMSPTFSDVESGYQREDLRDALRYVFFNERDPDTRRFALRAELLDAPLQIELQPGEPKRARVTIAVRIVRLSGEGEKPWWDARIGGDWELAEAGWRWTRTTEVNHSERPGRP